MTVELRRTISAPQAVFGVPGSPLFILSDRNPVALFNGKANIGVASSVVRASNINRLSLTLVNDSNNEIYINKSGTAVVNEGIRLNRRGGAVIITDYTGAISAIASVASSNLTISEVDQLP